MIRKLIFLFVTIIFSSNSWGQVVRLQFIDSKSGENIPNVNCIASFNSANIVDTSFQLQSNSKGNTEFRYLNLKVGSTLNLKISHPIYESSSKSIRIKEVKDTMKFEFLLIPVKVQNIKEVVVKAPGVPDTVFKSERLSVADFELQNNGNILLLAYPKLLTKGSELILYNGQQIISSFQVDDQAQYLARDYRGNTHVICKESTYGILISEKEIQVGKLPKDYYFKYVAPIVDTNSVKLFFSNFNKDYPAFEYFAMDLQDSTYKTILNIKDDLMMELYRSEYKWMDVRTKLWAKNKEVETGIDAEIWVGANYFTQSIYYKEVYAPMFQKNDTIYVFNYPKDRLEKYNREGNLIESIGIFHHYHSKQTGWKRELIQDKKTGVVYTIYEKTGTTYLGIIDLKTGEVSEKVKLGFRYVDKIRVQDNMVYYVYRPFESTQKKFLYREKLPYNFKEVSTNSGTVIGIK